MMSVRCLRSVASLTTAGSPRSRISTRLGRSRRCSKSSATRPRAVRSCWPSLRWAIMKPRMVGRRRSALSAAAAPYSRSSLARAALRIGYGAGRVFRLDLVIDERIEQELFSHVLEEVLLSPALEHAVGDLDVAQIPPAGDHLRLMAALAQARDLPQAQLAFEQAHGLVVQKIINPAPIELVATPDQAPLIDATTPAPAIGHQVEAALDYCGAQFRAPTAAVEDDGDPSLADQVPHFAEDPGQGPGQRRVD